MLENYLEKKKGQYKKSIESQKGRWQRGQLEFFGCFPQKRPKEAIYFKKIIIRLFFFSLSLFSFFYSKSCWRLTRSWNKFCLPFFPPSADIRSAVAYRRRRRAHIALTAKRTAAPASCQMALVYSWKKREKRENFQLTPLSLSLSLSLCVCLSAFLFISALSFPLTSLCLSLCCVEL